MAGANDYSKRRFLLVEDEHFMAGLIERALRQLKPSEVFKVPNGETALNFFKDDKFRIDCIISDFNMKPVNGLQLLQAIRCGANPNIPREQLFLMLTGHGEEEVVRKSIALDVNGYLVKPVSPQKLFQTLDQLFERNVALKEVAHYRKVDVGHEDSHDESGASRAPAWVILTPEDLIRSNSALKDKVERLRTETASHSAADEVRIKNRQQCDLAQLRDGMLLAEDIHAQEGVVLLRKGTRLTSRMVERLREIGAESKARGFVWVGELA